VPLYQRASGFGFPGVRVDGNDVVAVYAVTKAALDHAREGNGPTFVEAFTYRMGAHTTSDDPTRYRVAAEVEVWKQRDPIVRLRTYLERQGMIDEAFLAGLEQESDELAAHVRQGCLAMADPAPLAMFDHVYVDPHPLVDEERAQFADYLSSFEGEAAH
jgi:pyruvate dehydrogenase E1 component alpha subunit